MNYRRAVSVWAVIALLLAAAAMIWWPDAMAAGGDPWAGSLISAGLILWSLALLLAEFGRRRLAVTAAALAWIMAAGCLVATGLSPDDAGSFATFEASRLAAGAILFLGTAGLVLALLDGNDARRLAFSMIGPVLSALYALMIATAVFLGSDDAYRWGEYLDMPMIVGAAFLALAIGQRQWAVRLIPSSVPNRARWAGLHAGAGLAGAFLVAGYWISVVELRSLHDHVQETAHGAAGYFERALEEQFKAYSRFIQRHAVDQSAGNNDWREDAGHYLDDFPFLLAIMRSEPAAGTTETIASGDAFTPPALTELSPVLHRIADGGHEAAVIKATCKQNTDCLIFKFDSGPRHFFFLNDFSEFADSFLNDVFQQRYSIEFSRGDEILLASGDGDGERPDTLAFAESPVEFHGMAFALRVGLTSHSVRSLRASLAPDLVIAGMLFAALFAYTVYLGRKSYLDSRRFRNLNQRHQRILECATVGIYGVDETGRATFFNPMAEKLLGFEAGEVRDRVLHDLMHHTKSDGGDYPSEECPVYRAAADGETRYVNDEIFWRKDGTSLPVEYRCSPLYEGERITGAVTFFVDTTERRKAEIRAKQAYRDLESFAYTVSHDLRAPVRAMSGFSEALIEDYGEDLPGEARAYLQRIKDSGVRLSQMIDDLLAFSRAGRDELNLETVDLTAIAETVFEELRARDSHRTVELAAEPDMFVTGDRRYLELALRNLLENAWKFTAKRDDGRISVGKTLIQGNPTFYVADNGAGFDPRFRDKLFQPFQRLHGDTEFEGNGIGLALVQRIILRHGGRVWAEGEKGNGATIYFAL